MAEPFTDFFILDVEMVFRYGQVWRLMTGAFLHADLWHILFNMLFLWWFGSELESIYGSKEFLTFYLVSALFASLAYCGFEGVQVLTGQAGGFSRALGASGAVTAVMLVYACHFPTRVIYLFFVLPVPIWLFVAFHVGRDALALISGVHNGVGVTAHLGGALIGFLYYKFEWRLSPFFTNLRLPNFRRRRQPRLRVYREEEPYREPVAAAAAARRNLDEQLEAKLDAILEKIKVSGKESLTESEREMLLRASEIYKQRRSSKEGV
jgi:membrane associated rhomboid family serine protease